MKSSPPSKILIVRTDRIGDVVLSLPMIGVLRRNFPDARISFLAQTYTSTLLTNHPGLDDVLLYSKHGATKGFFQILKELRGPAFDVVVVAHPTFRLALLMLLAGIPVRVGTGYRWYSSLFNRRVYEHRKTADRHEAEFNISLLRAIGCEDTGWTGPSLSLNSEAGKRVDEICAGLGLSESEELVVLHPGSGGSARDWPPERFGQLAAVLSTAGYRTVITGGRGEEDLVHRVASAGGDRTVSLGGVFTLDELAWFLKRARLFISNSTGPLHIAAALGVPVIAFYPPIRACSSRRWGPLTPNKVLFEPRSEDCPRCRGGECQGDDCMRLITVEEVQWAAIRLLDHVVSDSGKG